MAKQQPERHLAAILAADVAGYSRLMGANEEGTLARLKEHRRELGDPKIREHRGHIIKTTGDGILVEFASAVDAVRCAVEIQRGMVERNADVPPEDRIEFRIGINVGDIIADDGDIFGNGVNVAARLEAIADRGGICISRQVLDQIEDKLELSFRELGRQNLKIFPSRLKFTPLNCISRATGHPPFLPTQVSSKRLGIAARPTGCA